MVREIALDTETTGMAPNNGDRIVEIGCVELNGSIPTGKNFHVYLNPQRDMPDGAFRVHGLSSEFLKDKSLFAEVVDEFLEFIGDSKMVIHNASFDMGFINAELGRAGFKPLPMSQTIDTVLMARKKFPGSPANLDALCRRYEIDLSARTKHGALLDAELLAEVYLELTGGRQAGLGLRQEMAAQAAKRATKEKTLREARDFPLSDADKEAHEKMLAAMKSPIWKQA